MHQLLHHTIEPKRVMDAVGAFWTVHDVDQVAKVSEGIGKHVHLLRAKAKEDKYLRSKESAAIASIADPTFMIVPDPLPITENKYDVQAVEINTDFRVRSPPLNELVLSKNLKRRKCSIEGSNGPTNLADIQKRAHMPFWWQSRR